MKNDWMLGIFFLWWLVFAFLFCGYLTIYGISSVDPTTILMMLGASFIAVFGGTGVLFVGALILDKIKPCGW